VVWAGGLRERDGLTEQPFGEQALLCQPDPGVEERDGQFVGQSLQMVRHGQPVTLVRVDEVHVVIPTRVSQASTLSTA
jgi:hypothetical protein